MIWRTIPFQKKLIGQASPIRVRNISTSDSLRKTFYEVLGLKKDATTAEIKKAYFELSKLYHPDRIEATDANLAKFREITAAYEILSNENSKRLYDRGLLGDSTKPIVEDSNEVFDPIVKFYKQRQELSKEFLKPPGDVKTWAPPPRKHGKSKILQKYNYYRKPSGLTYLTEEPGRYDFILGVVILSTFLIFVNLKGSSTYNLFHKSEE